MKVDWMHKQTDRFDYNPTKNLKRVLRGARNTYDMLRNEEKNHIPQSLQLESFL